MLEGGGQKAGVSVSASPRTYTVYHKEGKKKKDALDDSNIMAMIERELKDGCHVNPDRRILNGLGTSHLHTAKALKAELEIGGLANTTVHGVMGGAWLAPNLDELLSNETTKEALMATVRLIDTYEEVIGLSGHLLAISRKE